MSILKRFLSLFLGIMLIALTSCNSTTEEPKQQDTSVVIDSILQTSLTIEGSIDGPEQEFYLEFNEGKPDSLSQFNQIDIIPASYIGPDDYIYLGMIGVLRQHFNFYGSLEGFTGNITIYYDRLKSKKMISYQSINGAPNDTCITFTPQGKPYISRIYKNGLVIASLIEPFACNWKFSQKESSLTITDSSQAFSKKDNNIIVSLMDPQIGFSYKNSLDAIIEKESFTKPFKINNHVFTGKLIGYFHPQEFDSLVFFELNFSNGLLEGDVIINSYWGDLRLHELFNQGTLTETIYQAPEENGDVAKPIIYMYPIQPTKINVEIDFDGLLTHTYPKYSNGWNITAYPDGTLKDDSGKEYYALFWEGKENKSFQITEGNVVAGKNTINFLEKNLAKLGLNAKEANEFIIYWLPQMENNPYNLIHFSTAEYEEMAKLTITPQPETMIRVMMVFQPLKEPISIKKQDLGALSKSRKGFTVVEWGGKKINKNENTPI